MSYTVITIERQFGSGGHVIGQKLAEKLGFAYYDKKLIEMAAEKSGLSQGMLSDVDEKAANPWLYAAMNQTGQTNFGTVNFCTNDTLFNTQAEIIRNIAKTENAVIVGRCSDYVLRNQDVNIINVFIYAPMAARIKRTMERNGITEAQAVSLIKKTDKQRKFYYEFYTDGKWSSHSNYDITINSEKFGLDGSADIICGAVNLK